MAAQPHAIKHEILDKITQLGNYGAYNLQTIRGNNTTTSQILELLNTVSDAVQRLIDAKNSQKKELDARNAELASTKKQLEEAKRRCGEGIKRIQGESRTRIEEAERRKEQELAGAEARKQSELQAARVDFEGEKSRIESEKRSENERHAADVAAKQRQLVALGAAGKASSAEAQRLQDEISATQARHAQVLQELEQRLSSERADFEAQRSAAEASFQQAQVAAAEAAQQSQARAVSEETGRCNAELAAYEDAITQALDRSLTSQATFLRDLGETVNIDQLREIRDKIQALIAAAGGAVGARGEGDGGEGDGGGGLLDGLFGLFGGPEEPRPAAAASASASAAPAAAAAAPAFGAARPIAGISPASGLGSRGPKSSSGNVSDIFGQVTAMAQPKVGGRRTRKARKTRKNKKNKNKNKRVTRRGRKGGAKRSRKHH